MAAVMRTRGTPKASAQARRGVPRRDPREHSHTAEHQRVPQEVERQVAAERAEVHRARAVRAEGGHVLPAGDPQVLQRAVPKVGMNDPERGEGEQDRRRGRHRPQADFAPPQPAVQHQREQRQGEEACLEAHGLRPEQAGATEQELRDRSPPQPSQHAAGGCEQEQVAVDVRHGGDAEDQPVREGYRQHGRQQVHPAVAEQQVGQADQGEDAQQPGQAGEEARHQEHVAPELQEQAHEQLVEGRPDERLQLVGPRQVQRHQRPRALVEGDAVEADAEKAGLEDERRREHGRERGRVGQIRRDGVHTDATGSGGGGRICGHAALASSGGSAARNSNNACVRGGPAARLQSGTERRRHSTGRSRASAEGLAPTPTSGRTFGDGMWDRLPGRIRWGCAGPRRRALRPRLAGRRRRQPWPSASDSSAGRT